MTVEENIGFPLKMFSNKTPKENRYYDNPDTQMHVLLQFLFAKVGINIDALG